MKTHLKIRFIRDQKDLSQSYMANKLQISQSKYNKLETGKSKICIQSFYLISKILDIRMDDLYNLPLESFSTERLQSLSISSNYLNTISVEEKERILMLLANQFNKPIDKP